MKLLSCTYFSIFFAASAWTEESSKSNTILDLANSACETHISIHAPMKGATEHDISVTSVPLISIRTPTKGATIKSPNSKLFFIISIHAPAKGATQIAELGTTKTLFQSTLPRRERLFHDSIFFAQHYFNPRSREGSDPMQYTGGHRSSISIHAPAKGATKIDGEFLGLSDISIHAPAKGATWQR